jgi:hypothetical protein
MKIQGRDSDLAGSLSVSIRADLISLHETMKGIFYYQESAWRSRQAANGP